MQKHHWFSKKFSSLSTNELFDIYKLRVDVFVVEQTCFYPEIDEHDKHPETIHLFTYCCDENTHNENLSLQNKPIAAYLRILPKETRYKEIISIGRVVVANTHRGVGLGNLLMKKALDTCAEHFPMQPIQISAQEHLEHYYNQHGFYKISAMYLEDNIPHISMLKK